MKIKNENDLFKLIDELNKIHNNKYDYSLIEINKPIKYIDIICSKHVKFTQKLCHHKSGSGCSSCSNNKKLNNKNIKYEEQKSFKKCKNKRLLPFDFYLPEYNICIKFDGIQHYKPVKQYGGYDNFNKQKINDEIKNDFCLVNNIKLLRIKYNENIIEFLNNNINFV